MYIDLQIHTIYNEIMTKRTTLLGFFCLAFAFSVKVSGHGELEKQVETHYHPAPMSFWEFFLAEANAAAKIKKKGNYRYIESDGIPDHATGKFPNSGNPHSIEKQDHEFRVPRKPEKRRSPTFIGMSAFGVALNGVPFDPATAEYWNRDRSSGWNVEAMGGGMSLGLDQNNAHVQPNGAYHYHAVPTALMERGAQFEKPVMLGYAADGFPIYGPFGYKVAGDMMSEMVQLKPGWTLKDGERSGGPGGRYDGTYSQDYVYRKGTGDLDTCNGREGRTPEYPEGTYYYVITDAWPYIPRCWMGKPDESFRKAPPPGHEPLPPPPPPSEEELEKRRQERKEKADARRRRLPAMNPRDACENRRSGAFCRFRTRDMRVIEGTCRADLGNLVCVPIWR